VPNTLSLESRLFGLVGTQLKTMGHDVRSVDGTNLGGYQAIMFTPDPDAPAAPGDAPQPIRGFYRAGSDHRKDGQAAGF
jgi:gamma-glutamyltranspeptidase / glutathione hydrolase